MADQWSAATFGAGLARTPAFDRFARESIECIRAYATNPECSPSRASILTGRLPHQHGVVANNVMLPESEVGLAEHFRSAGHATHYIGKWHLDGPATPGFVPPGWRRHGFETFEGFNRGHTYDRFTTFTNAGEELHLAGFEPTFQTGLAIEFLRAKGVRPFLCFLSFGPPHARVNELTPDLRTETSDYAWRPNVPEWIRRGELLQRKVLDSRSLCERLDVEMGRLLGELEVLGLSERTVVVFTSDHGDMLGSHGFLNKESPYEEALRVPLVVRVPGARARRVETPISGIDLWPTLASLCGLGPPGTCTGRSVADVLTEGAEAPRDVYVEGRMTKQTGKSRMPGKIAWRALITPTHKLVVNARGEVALLIDLAADSFELENLAGNPAHAALEAELLARFVAWKETTNDPFPDPLLEALPSDVPSTEPV